MPDTATPNLPSRDFDTTEDFYAQFGFECGYKDGGWMILYRGPKGSRAVLEFFPYPDLDPKSSSFSACLRLDDLPAIMAQVTASNVPQGHIGLPRFHPPQKEASGLTIAYLVDCDGSLIRLIQNN
ncbi:bleomycin resistance protein [Erythrobacter crassostreae]|uniref:Bleomycin resistance protein n=1 Tax=Erythrobacter crassostreae TaxID=2828328 RepID=A0A9X1F5C7_9SPHN|nr:bleomycin resistance protein [Erythrobacter crassostrea]